ncbi:taurine transport system substrate-binding protein [Mameliella alba]|uniref:taurine ABC transporter substrate-binding protein n=1 Tax=Mameliella alba TaxID=561184 RepID=UPI00088B363C|nr:ABC transporter substrate-binding protein [Mameliella alba]OWV49133.1 taurine ABC transporter substrate-binding protein [Mameliella alba]PTR40880.1 taurine transport system substrate-binding protein [Mameliella alba]GGF47020.1 taurine ABC transporter substrate-binding protein [Mameliella alba]SDC61408.1 taurine transport system substrate-binding protein [Mameliella alba]
MTLKNTLKGAAAALAVMAGTTAVSAQEITVGYFLEWPMPFQYAKAEGMYDEAMGVTINWVSFDTGTAMSAAMASGDVQLSVSQGVPPFVVATSAGQDLQILDVAVSYSDNDNCVVLEALEIDKDSAIELEGKKVAVPLGTAAHYGFLKQMSHFGVDITTMEVVDMAPPDGAAALAQGSVDMACGWGGSLRRMKEHGNVLLTGAEKEDLGILVFDVTSGPAGWVAENSDIVASFLAVTAEANAMWADPANHDMMLPVIAKDAGMDVDATEATISTFVFPSVDDQLTAKWLGGGAQEFMKGVADVFVEAGSIDAALDSYDANVNTGPLSSAAGGM